MTHAIGIERAGAAIKSKLWEATSVVLVIVVTDAGDEYGIFSDIAKAEAWADGKDDPCVVVNPMVLDDPEFGNVQQQ
jgi:hypothetical protein